tara:strand:+ start:364 stop:912 length:549 start_codon:yes stop_codon:yes gene_type:complete
MPQSRLGLKRYKPRTGPAGEPKKPKYTTSFHKSKAAAKKDKGKPNTPGEKMREYKGKMTMGQIRNKKTFAGETGLEGMKKKLNYQRRGKASGGSVGDLNKDGKMSGYETARSNAIQKAMQKRKTMKKGGSATKDTHVTKEGKTAKKGLWYNIHQKRKRGEKMRKKGAKGAPTAKAIRRSQSK